MHDPLDASTIIFALLAIFVLWKLRSVLGTRTGSEKPPSAPFLRRPVEDGKVVPLPGVATRPAIEAGTDRWRPYAEPGSKTAEGLDAIAAASPGFTIDPFLRGAKTAYEMIVTAFAAGDLQTLQNLLDKDVFDSFSAAVAGRESRGESMTTRVASIDQVTIEEASMRGKFAQITLRFSAELVSATRDKSGAVISGDPEHSADTADIWTFARDVSSRDPNWKLAATQTGH